MSGGEYKTQSSPSKGASKIGAVLGGGSPPPPPSSSGRRLADAGDDDEDGLITDEAVKAYGDYKTLSAAGDHKGAAMALKAWVKEYC